MIFEVVAAIVALSAGAFFFLKALIKGRFALAWGTLGIVAAYAPIRIYHFLLVRTVAAGLVPLDVGRNDSGLALYMIALGAPGIGAGVAIAVVTYKKTLLNQWKIVPPNHKPDLIAVASICAVVVLVIAAAILLPENAPPEGPQGRGGRADSQTVPACVWEPPRMSHPAAVTGNAGPVSPPCEPSQSSFPLTVRVVDEAGAPVGDSVIAVSGPCSRSATTDTRGLVIVRLEDGLFGSGDYLVVARAGEPNDGMIGFAKARIGESQRSATVRIVVSPSREVRGRVVDSRGGPIAGERVGVFWKPATFPRPVVLARTDATGAFMIAVPRNTTCDLLMAKSGKALTTVTIGPDDKPAVDVGLLVVK